ncbi:hypothetical protein RND71_039912 [Anisodus tanguticus]|uniref:F-box/LRR-repeat protein 15/At3g58940/PEG3-like LRR domain-containing protein n=1 Tax=Anisodus tanguticus TaxID=243964 RepID=A0AAE1UVS4_9SOLA|nr:hypothetical protein RND71_039912 [Anisodus tanguticus]
MQAFPWCLKSKKRKSFFIHILAKWDFVSKISQWLCFAVENKVEDVKLYSYPFADEELSLSMYTCWSLITLNLSCWVFDEEMVIAWNSLKSLTLHSTTLYNEDIVKLLSSCPALETMELSFCKGCRRLKIASSNLKRLNLHNYWSSPYEECDKSFTSSAFGNNRKSKISQV